MVDMEKPIPIGIEFYKEMIDGGYYYVDKTLLIRDILKQRSKVTLFTRPRRFGKTLALSTLQTFFEHEIKPDGSVVDNSAYFDGKKIMDAGEEYVRHMGRYPLIFLTLKSAKQPTYQMAYDFLVNGIMAEYERHRYLLQDDVLSDRQKERYAAIMDRRAEPSEYAGALQYLSHCLEQYHGEKTVILIDEYDVPLENAFYAGFYDEMLGFIRSLFESALKTNTSLNFAVVTGCLRISKESIFTGLNNLNIISILDDSYAEYFGFTAGEVEKVLEYYGIADRMEEAKQWYNGYLFGRTEVYNPWSIIKYVFDIVQKNTEFPKPYWSNTSSNSIIRDLVEQADQNTKKEIEQLIAGGTIEKQVHEEITYGDIYQTRDNLWNFLFFTGYLKEVGRRFDMESIYLTMQIPNREIRYIYNNTIRTWCQQMLESEDHSELYTAIVNGDIKRWETLLQKRLKESISFLDSAENFYHGFLLGLLAGMQDYRSISNRESGNGRYDVALEPDDRDLPVIIIELKVTAKYGEMESKCQEALQQIDEKQYDAEFVEMGYPHIMKYGICFCRKNCMIQLKD